MKTEQHTMIRVSEEFTCHVCQKPDWCMRDSEGYTAYCMRVACGSFKTIKFRDGNLCHIHQFDKAHKPARVPWTKIIRDKKYPINWQALQDLYTTDCNDCSEVEKAFGRGWDSEAVTYPMYNSDFKIVGIQRRFPNGKKAAVKGTTNGLFMPVEKIIDDLHSDYMIDGAVSLEPTVVLICEGVSDAMAAMELRFAAIGRNNCSTGQGDILRLFDGVWVNKTPIIIADEDVPGIRGAERLQMLLLNELEKQSIMIIPPTGVKDLKIWKESGLTFDKLYEVIQECLKWIQ